MKIELFEFLSNRLYRTTSTKNNNNCITIERKREELTAAYCHNLKAILWLCVFTKHPVLSSLNRYIKNKNDETSVQNVCSYQYYHTNVCFLPLRFSTVFCGNHGNDDDDIGQHKSYLFNEKTAKNKNCWNQYDLLKCREMLFTVHSNHSYCLYKYNIHSLFVRFWFTIGF